MSKEIERVVDSVLPEPHEAFDIKTKTMRNNDRDTLRLALASGVLCVPLSEEEIEKVIGEDMASTDDWDSVSLAKAIHAAQFKGVI